MMHQSSILSGLAVLALILPSMALSYVFWVPNLGNITMHFGQYVFFAVVIICAVCFSLKIGFRVIGELLCTKYITFCAMLFLIGLALSTAVFWNVRLLLIVTCISYSAIITAFFLYRSTNLSEPVIAFILLLPFSFPTFMAFILEYFGPIHIGIELINVKHENFTPNRWHFLSRTANGFGMNAAITFSALYMAGFLVSEWRWKLIYAGLGIIAAVSLFYSGTRAAFVFAFLSIFAFHHFYFGARFILIFIIVLSCAIFSTIAIFGLSETLGYLRIGGDLNSISSLRWQGITGLWEIFQSSPLAGKGFGAADNGLPVYPTNIFYVALLVEVGIFGFVGALGVLFLPAWLCVRQIIEKKQLAFLRDKSFLLVFSTCCLAGFVPYLFLEFNILRVSAVNQLFFFFWGYLYFTLQQEQKIYLKDNGRG